jgi:methyl-accepting chemotaxis protein
VAEGRLDNDIHITSHDETGALLTALTKMQDKLHAVLKEVDDCGRNMGQSAFQVAAISNEISDVSKQQEGQSGEVTSAMQQVHQISSEVQVQAIDASDRTDQVEKTGTRRDRERPAEHRLHGRNHASGQPCIG